MTSLSRVDSAPALSSARTMVPSWRLCLHASAILAFAGGYGIGHLAAAESVAAEPGLTMLLRFMAVMKLGMALGAWALIHWRLSHPIGGGLAFGTIAAVVPMLVGPGLIWHMAWVAQGAVLFHVGLFLFLGLAWVDRGGRETFKAASVWDRKATATASVFDQLK